MTILTANTPTLLYTCPAGKVATKNVRFCNTSVAAATFSVWKGTTTPTPGTPITGDELAYAFTLGGNTISETTGIYLVAGEKLYGMVSAAAVSVNQYGPERNV